MVTWTAKSKGARARTGKPNLIVLHHTGGERDHNGVCSTLKTRGLSVHYVVGADGLITEHADAETVVTLHAGAVNGRSISIEIVNRGLAPHAGKHPRPAYRDHVHGNGALFLRFHEIQVDAVDVLCRDLSALFDIPLRLPMVVDGSVSRAVLDLKTRGSWVGVLGHLHVSPLKIDPSPHLLDDLAERWAVC